MEPNTIRTDWKIEPGTSYSKADFTSSCEALDKREGG